MKRILIIEPFYGGSHKVLIDTLISELRSEEYVLITMKAKKWHWRARCSSLYLSQQIQEPESFHALFCSSVVNLSELVGLCPALAKLKKIVYFHENQLIYPVKSVKERDFQYGYNQITTCLAADHVLFNSEFNKNSFLNNINNFLKLMPDYKLKNFPQLIEPKCRIIYFPMDFCNIDKFKRPAKLLNSHDTLNLVWPHRWEYDKNPDLLFKALYSLVEKNVKFTISIIGQCFHEIPECFIDAKDKLTDRIKHFGFVPSKEEFYEVLMDSDVVISTADHEFFGVSIMEAVRLGCLPLLPNKVVYPEFYPNNLLYNNEDDFINKLQDWCSNPGVVEHLRKELCIDLDRFDTKIVSSSILNILTSL